MLRSRRDPAITRRRQVLISDSILSVSIHKYFPIYCTKIMITIDFNSRRLSQDEISDVLRGAWKCGAGNSNVGLSVLEKFLRWLNIPCSPKVMGMAKQVSEASAGKRDVEQGLNAFLILRANAKPTEARRMSVSFEVSGGAEAPVVRFKIDHRAIHEIVIADLGDLRACYRVAVNRGESDAVCFKNEDVRAAERLLDAFSNGDGHVPGKGDVDAVIKAVQNVRVWQLAEQSKKFLKSLNDFFDQSSASWDPRGWDLTGVSCNDLEHPDMKMVNLERLSFASAKQQGFDFSGVTVEQIRRLRIDCRESTAAELEEAGVVGDVEQLAPRKQPAVVRSYADLLGSNSLV